MSSNASCIYFKRCLDMRAPKTDDRCLLENQIVEWLFRPWNPRKYMRLIRAFISFLYFNLFPQQMSNENEIISTLHYYNLRKFFLSFYLYNQLNHISSGVMNSSKASYLVCTF